MKWNLHKSLKIKKLSRGTGSWTLIDGFVLTITFVTDKIIVCSLDYPFTISYWLRWVIIVSARPIKILIDSSSFAQDCHRHYTLRFPWIYTIHDKRFRLCVQFFKSPIFYHWIIPPFENDYPSMTPRHQASFILYFTMMKQTPQWIELLMMFHDEILFFFPSLPKCFGFNPNDFTHFLMALSETLNFLPTWT